MWPTDNIYKLITSTINQDDVNKVIIHYPDKTTRWYDPSITIMSDNVDEIIQYLVFTEPGTGCPVNWKTPETEIYIDNGMWIVHPVTHLYPTSNIEMKFVSFDL